MLFGAAGMVFSMVILAVMVGRFLKTHEDVVNPDIRTILAVRDRELWLRYSSSSSIRSLQLVG